MERYVGVMRPGATLLMSGFYETDVPAIRACAEQLGLVYHHHRSRHDWVVIRFNK
jgi:ribosomal protein L11 methyltransferase